jgi:GalNAc-alpha-(1->4)-GalNAc-alpha-(1->3)-diNAcBac-PP-undecaprenol alpha-1,4-N-acetyl-D-galactosaminyltransferase
MSRKICIVINSLVQGGAQKSAILLAKELHQIGYEVKILTFYPQDTDFFEIPFGIQVERFIYPFQDNGRVTSNYKLGIRVQRIKNRIKDFRDLRASFFNFNPDLVISFEAATSVIAFFANYNLCPQIISERVHPKFHAIPKWASVLRPFVYRSKKTYLHCQGKSIASWMQEQYKKSVFVIPNFLGEKEKKIWNSESNKIKVFSRYTHQKGIDLAIDAWKSVSPKLRQEYRLEIYGDGDKGRYQELVTSLNLDSSIQLNGPTRNVQKEMSDCLLFLMPSRFEGFPNALAEAMGAGVPSLVTDSPSAVRDLTLDGRLARLVQPVPEEIGKHIESLITNKIELEKLSSAGMSVHSYFKDENTLSEWIDLIDWVLAGSVSSISNCLSCGGTRGKVVAYKTRASLRRELYSIWNIEVSARDMGNLSVITAIECKNCGSMNFNGAAGNSRFYDSCYESKSYTRDFWDYEFLFSRIKESDRLINILDFGGGLSPLAKLQLKNIHVSVIDISSKVREELDILNVTNYKDLLELPRNMKFDYITLCHVIEHVDNPSELIKDLVNLLVPGGFICVATPDRHFPLLLNSPLDWPPHHTIAFTRESLVRLMENSGLKNLSVVDNPNQSVPKFDFMAFAEK